MIKTPVTTAPGLPPPGAAIPSDPRARVGAVPPPAVAVQPPPSMAMPSDPRARAADPRAASRQTAGAPNFPPPPMMQPPTTMAPPTMQQQPQAAAAGVAGLDPNLVQQVMALTPQQIQLLPPDKQQSILALRQQITGGR